MSLLLLFPSAVSSNKSLTVDSGSVTVTGAAATLKYGRLVSAASANVTATGAAATLLRTWVLNAAGASVTVTGVDATLLYGSLITAEAANVNVDGQDATLTRVEVEQTRQGGGWAPAEYDDKTERNRRKKRREREEQLEKVIQAAFNAAMGIVPKAELPKAKAATPALARELATALATASGRGREFAELRRLVGELRRQAKLVDELSAHVAEQRQTEEEAIVMLLVA